MMTKHRSHSKTIARWGNIDRMGQIRKDMTMHVESPTMKDRRGDTE